MPQKSDSGPDGAARPALFAAAVLTGLLNILILWIFTAVFNH